MSVFQAVNTGLAPEPYNRNGDDTTPTTPRPDTVPTTQPPSLNRLDDATTPTRATFSALANQRPLPESPFPTPVTVPETADSEKKPLVRGDSQHSTKSRDSEDVDMDESDDGEEGSDEESINADGTRTMKKKKSQRFWCTEYPPCNLSFTRSEHLARHIRKHTGERPFQCHCSRRFSRLDNLRQHAQTVHVNEEIPGDSLAATGTRFQRQVRTDRVRPPGNRSRTNTATSQPGQGRGHHRNSLSASSISSFGSAYSSRDEARRRPPPLVMANDPRATRLSFENHSTTSDAPGQYQTYRPPSPGGFSTPTSATFSTGQNSPRWGSAMQSPVSSHSRTASLYAGHRTPGRRLSVPSGANPFQSPQGSSYGQPPLTPVNTSTPGYLSPLGNGLASPTSSTSGSTWSRRESINAADEAWRRRTWHPETYSNFTSRLVNVSTPNYYQNPVPANPQNTRLPGIESFDPLPRPATPPRRGPSPMMIDTPSRAPVIHSAEQYSRPDDRVHPPQWDMGLHRNLNRLDIAQGPPTDAAGAWASEANRAVQAQAEQARAQPSVRFEQVAPTRDPPNTYYSHRISAPPLTPRDSKRHGWYNGPVLVQNNPPGQRTSPEDSSSSEGGVPGTPGSASVTDYHPSIVHSSGWVEPSQRPPQPQAHLNYTSAAGDSSYIYAPGSRSMASNAAHEAPKADGMLRLEALVAVATSEENATAAY